MDKKSETKQSIDIKQNILTAACNLIIQKGVKETSLKDIAAEVGISKGTLYYYYSAKEDIIYDIADSHMQKITDELIAMIDDMNHELAPEEIFKTLFEKIVLAETRGKLNLYLISSAITNNESLRSRFNDRYEEWRKALEDGTRKVLSNKGIDYRVLSYFLLAALDGLIIQRLLGAKNIPFDDIAKLLANLE